MTETVVNALAGDVVETLDSQYRPRGPFVPYHMREQRFAAIVAHRRCGKTVACVADLIDDAVRCTRPEGRFAYIAPLFVQAKDAAWTYLKRYSKPFLSGLPNESELRVDLTNGSRIRLYGADAGGDRLRGIYLDGVVLDEYADMVPGVWDDVVRPMLADRQGRATFIGTPKGRNAFFEVYDAGTRDPDWFTLKLKASETGILPMEELLLLQKDQTEEAYAQEFECSFEAAIRGAYFGKEMAEAERSGRIRELPVEPSLPVHTAWDLGKGDNMAIWCFQVSVGEIRVVDFLQQYGFMMEHYCKELRRRGYNGIDFVPHDAKVPNLETGRTRIEYLVKVAKRNAQLVPMHNVDDGIEAARMTFPRCWFDRERCKVGLESLRQYRADFNEKTQAFMDTPKKDWATHGADAFRYLCMAWRDQLPDSNPKPKPKGRSFHELRFDDVWKHLLPGRQGIRI